MFSLRENEKSSNDKRDAKKVAASGEGDKPMCLFEYWCQEMARRPYQGAHDHDTHDWLPSHMFI